MGLGDRRTGDPEAELVAASPFALVLDPAGRAIGAGRVMGPGPLPIGPTGGFSIGAEGRRPAPGASIATGVVGAVGARGVLGFAGGPIGEGKDEFGRLFTLRLTL